MPAACQAHRVKPEQSKALGPGGAADVGATEAGDGLVEDGGDPLGGGLGLEEGGEGGQLLPGQLALAAVLGGPALGDLAGGVVDRGVGGDALRPGRHGRREGQGGEGDPAEDQPGHEAAQAGSGRTERGRIGTFREHCCERVADITAQRNATATFPPPWLTSSGMT